MLLFHPSESSYCPKKRRFGDAQCVDCGTGMGIDCFTTSKAVLHIHTNVVLVRVGKNEMFMNLYIALYTNMYVRCLLSYARVTCTVQVHAQANVDVQLR